MNVLVCDDERQIVDSIIETLEKKTEETQVSSRFYGFSQPSQIDLSLPYDIALLDIDMGETNGIELARKLRAENENILLHYPFSFSTLSLCSTFRAELSGLYKPEPTLRTSIWRCLRCSAVIAEACARC